MKTPRIRLQAARKARNWTQKRIADLIGVDRKTYNRWEMGETDPHPYGIERACQIFGLTASELDFHPDDPGIHQTSQEKDLQETSSLLSLASTGLEDEPSDWIVWMSTQQASLLTTLVAYGRSLPVREIQQMTDHHLRHMYAVLHHYEKQDEYHLSRRQALTTLAALPLAWKTIGTDQHLASNFITHCAVAIPTTWHLFRNDDYPAIERLLPHYIEPLAKLAQQSSSLQPEAARLAVLAKILQGLVAMHRFQIPFREHCCLEATMLASHARDPLIQALAWMYLGYTYALCPPPRLTLALEAFHKGLHSVSSSSSLIASDICLGLADIYAQQGQEKQALRYLHEAQNRFPAQWEMDEYALYADCGLNTLHQWTGKTYLSLAAHYPSQRYQHQAWDAIDQSLAITPLSDRSMNETILYRAEAARDLHDLDRYQESLEQGVQMALHGSKKLLFDVHHLFQQTPSVWLHEPRLQELAQNVFAPHTLVTQLPTSGIILPHRGK